MRPFLILGLSITLCASANAATVNHSRHHVIFRPSQGWAYAAPRPWTYAAPGPRIDYDDTPSYDDPSKFGGDQALPVTRKGFEFHPRGATATRSSLQHPPCLGPPAKGGLSLRQE
jgi:hypothetical protein